MTGCVLEHEESVVTFEKNLSVSLRMDLQVQLEKMLDC